MHIRMLNVARESAKAVRWPGLPKRLIAIVIAGGIAAAHAGSAPSLSASVIAGGGGSSQTPGACLKLDATIGQGLAGTSSGANFELRSGYWAVLGSTGDDSLFNNDFEECL